MGDIVEEIVAEPDEAGFLEKVFLFVHYIVRAYGWYFLIAMISIYYMWRKRWHIPNYRDSRPQTQEEIESWQAKEEKRLQAIQRLQQKYQSEAESKAEQQKLVEEEKKKARLAELEALNKSAEGHRLGGDRGDSSKKSLRPEFNPLMGGEDSNRVSFRRPGGGAGG